MRSALKEYSGTRGRFRARFIRYGERHSRLFGIYQKTILLRDVTKENEEILADHVWIENETSILSLHLKSGDLIEFDATVTPYLKGYFGTRKTALMEKKPMGVDYRLVDIENVTVVETAHGRQRVQVRPKVRPRRRQIPLGHDIPYGV